MWKNDRRRWFCGWLPPGVLKTSISKNVAYQGTTSIVPKQLVADYQSALADDTIPVAGLSRLRRQE
jgi:hypothetical protein